MEQIKPVIKPSIDVVALFQQGDKSAFVQLYNYYSPLLFGMFKRLCGDDNTCKDILAQVFAQIWQERADYDRKKEAVFYLDD